MCVSKKGKLIRSHSQHAGRWHCSVALLDLPLFYNSSIKEFKSWFQLKGQLGSCFYSLLYCNCHLCWKYLHFLYLLYLSSLPSKRCLCGGKSKFDLKGSLSDLMMYVDCGLWGLIWSLIYCQACLLTCPGPAHKNNCPKNPLADFLKEYCCRSLRNNC